MELTLLFTLGIALVILAVAAGLTARSRRARPLVMGVGLACVAVGLYLTGLTSLAINGINSLIAWFQRTVFTTVTAWGIGLAVGGLVLWIIGSRLSKEPKRPKEQPAAAAGTRGVPVTAGQPPAGQPTAKGRAASPGQQRAVDPEDAEIEALLRKRGIM